MVRLQKLVFSDRPDLQNRDRNSKEQFYRSGPEKPKDPLCKKQDYSAYAKLMLSIHEPCMSLWRVRQR